MIRFNRFSRLFCGAVGCLLLSGGLVVGYWWCYKLAPLRHLADSQWRADHSEKARWAEEQANYRRLGSPPDVFFRGDRIGFYGDKAWCLWLVKRAMEPEHFHVCGCTEYALALMANRHVSSWAEWVEANRERTQEEWIKDGFAEYEVTVHLPPQPDDAPPLLKLLGRKRWDFLVAGPQGTNAPEAAPSYVHYDAFRWLRDSGFNPSEFAASNPESLGSREIVLGLIQYSWWHTAYPGRHGLGVLAFGRKAEPEADPWGRPLLLKPWFVAAAYALIVVPVVGGVVLLFKSRNQRPKAATGQGASLPSG